MKTYYFFSVSYIKFSPHLILTWSVDTYLALQDPSDLSLLHYSRLVTGFDCSNQDLAWKQSR